MIIKVGGKELGLSHTAKATCLWLQKRQTERRDKWSGESACDPLKYPWRQRMLCSHVIRGQFVPELTFCWSCDRPRLAKRGVENAAAELESWRRTMCVSTVDYGESLWFHLFHIHEPNGARCNIHGQIRRSKHQCERGRMQNALTWTSSTLSWPINFHFIPFHLPILVLGAGFLACWTYSIDYFYCSTKFQAVVFTEKSFHCLLALVKQNDSFFFKE